MTKLRMLMGASALITASLAFATGAQATDHVYGAGSSLAAGLIRQAGDCYGVQTPLILFSTAGAADHAQVYTTLPYFNYVPATGFGRNCADGPIDAGKQVDYVSTGSGTGIDGYYSHSASTFWGNTDPSNTTTASPYPSVHYALSDYGLDGVETARYTAGGTEGNVVMPGTFPIPAPLYGPQIQIPILISTVTFAYDPVYKKVTDATGTVTTSYKFKLKKVNADGSGGLVLSIPAVCGIFNGTITNWNDPILKTLNGNTSLRDPTDPTPEGTPSTPGTWQYTGAGGGLPLEPVGRNDSSGTTSILFRALAAQCDSAHGYTGANAYTAAGGKKLPASLQGPIYTGGDNNGAGNAVTPVVGKITRANLSSGVADYVAFRLTPPASTTYKQGRLGFVSPDYALPAVTFSGVNTYNLNVANVKPRTTLATAVEPTAANALKAFGTILPPQSDTLGNYTSTPAATSHGARSAPQDWAEPLATTVLYSTDSTAVATPLADPNAASATSVFYPFVGTTNASLYTCYNGAATTAAVKGFFGFTENSKPKTPTSSATVTTQLMNTATTGLLAKSGFSALPKAWLNAIYSTFITPTTKATAPLLPTNALNLNILAAGTGPVSGTGSQCHAITPGA